MAESRRVLPLQLLLSAHGKLSASSEDISGYFEELVFYLLKT